MAMHDRVIDLALDAYPLAPVPAGFSRRVMDEVRQVRASQLAAAAQASPRQQAAPEALAKVSFRFDFLDLILPVFFASLAAAVLAVILGAIWFTNPEFALAARAYIEIALYRMTVVPAWWKFGAAACLGAGSLAILVMGFGLTWLLQQPVGMPRFEPHLEKQA